MALLIVPLQLTFSQHITKDNYSGNWEDPASWIPVWTSPQTIILNFDAQIYGYITANSSISLSGLVDALTIADTLVIHGNLSINNNCRVVINDGGVLIVRGNLDINNQSTITANGYLIVTGSLTKNGSITQGALTSNDNPPKFFICGTISPSQITSNASAYPVLNCVGTSITRYQNSSCSYGNCEDLKLDQIYSFFQSTCINVTARSNSPVCQGASLILTGGPASMNTYAWTGPNGFASSSQSPFVSGSASAPMEGTYTLTVTSNEGCTAVATAIVVVNIPGATASSNSPVCEGDTIVLKSTEGSGFIWTGPDNYTSTDQNPIITIASLSMAGDYKVTLADQNGCQASSVVKVNVNPLPVVNITSNTDPMCLDETRTLTGFPTGGTFTVAGGPGAISGNILSATGIGIVTLTYSYTDKCSNISTQSIIMVDRPVLDPGPDQKLEYLFETKMNANLAESQTGEWSLISGSGQISDINSPVTDITGLKIGENIFNWSVRSGNCVANAEVKITVNDLFIPSVITPNGDGKNDFFKVNALIGSVELVIINKWGLIEYSSNNYHNDWDGRNDKGTPLKSDVYFYVLKFGNGLIRKGTVLIIR